MPYNLQLSPPLPSSLASVIQVDLEKWPLKRREIIVFFCRMLLTQGFNTDNSTLSSVRMGCSTCPSAGDTARLWPISLAAVISGSGVERIDLLHFLAGCRNRRLNQALSVLSLSLDFLFEYVCCAVVLWYFALLV